MQRAAGTDRQQPSDAHESMHAGRGVALWPRDTPRQGLNRQAKRERHPHAACHPNRQARAMWPAAGYTSAIQHNVSGGSHQAHQRGRIHAGTTTPRSAQPTCGSEKQKANLDAALARQVGGKGAPPGTAQPQSSPTQPQPRGPAGCNERATAIWVVQRWQRQTHRQKAAQTAQRPAARMQRERQQGTGSPAHGPASQPPSTLAQHLAPHPGIKQTTAPHEGGARAAPGAGHWPTSTAG